MSRPSIASMFLILCLLIGMAAPAAAQDSSTAVDQSTTGEVNLDLSNVDELSALQQGITSLTGNGNVSSSVTAALTNIAATTGAGPDSLSVVNSAETTVDQTGAGANTVEQSAELSTDSGGLSGISVGPGADAVTLENSALAGYQGNGDAGADMIDQQAILDATVGLGAGDDLGSIANSSVIDYAGGGSVDCSSDALAVVDMSGGFGDDTINLSNESLVTCENLLDPANSSMTGTADLDAAVQGGPGDDSISIDNISVIAGANPAADVLAEANLTLDVHGGFGDDTITVSNVADVVPDVGVETGVVTGIITGGFGDDSISVDATGSHVEDLGILGGFGDDTIYNSASGQNVLIAGGFGDDEITNDGILSGSNIFAGGGDDLVVNNGEVDSIFAGPGQDTVMNFGNSVLYNIQTGLGDDSVLNAGLVGGNIETLFGDDTVANSGHVGGDINLGAGDDVMIVQTGSSVGGTMDGGPGTDTLSLQVNVGEVSEDEADALAAQIAAAVFTTQHSGSGTMVIGGQVYTWTNFEALLNLITWAIRTHQTSFTIGFLHFTDGRLNYLDIAAPVAIYCTPNGIEVWDIDHSTGAGSPVIITSPANLQQLLQITGLDDIITLLPDGTAQVMAADLYGGVYYFSFNPSVCLPAVQ